MKPTRTAVVESATVPTPARQGDRLLVSVGEALWRTGWDLDRAGFMARLEAVCPDALVMTGKGVKVDLIHLLGSPNDGTPAQLPALSVVGPFEFDSLR
jgi:hypothetical protein